VELLEFQRRLGLEVDELSGRECRRLEPMLTPSVRGGILVAGDHSVDNRRLANALLTACDLAGVELRQAAVAELIVSGDRATGVQLADGDTVSAATVLLAAGAWSADLPGLPPGIAPPVRPVKGQILRLRSRGGFLDRTVRALVAGHHVYCVPRADGELVVGATSEELGFDSTTKAGGVYELLRDAHAVLPGISELELVEASAGLRPGSPDNAPILGPTALPGLLVATGHHRNGVLLTPVTGDVIAAVVETGELPEVAATFTPKRFAEVPA
jgi:glycine oxidase